VNREEENWHEEVADKGCEYELVGRQVEDPRSNKQGEASGGNAELHVVPHHPNGFVSRPV
jgi:hypothetical protein